MHLVESWKRTLDRGENVGATMMEPSKAFDCLSSHDLLIAKHRAYGFSNNDCNFILNYWSTDNKELTLVTFSVAGWTKEGTPG